MKILLVDDDLDLLSVTSFALQQAGMLVVQAASFDSALTVFRSERPDLAILDINLPGGSGFDLCQALRRESTLPILMLTVRNEEADLVRALELSADDYLTKPYSPRTLIARVKALLRRAGTDGALKNEAGPFRLDPSALELHVGATVHRVTPLSPGVPSTIGRKLHERSIPFVLGPLNGGVPWPRGFDQERRREGEWLGRFRGLHRVLPYYWDTRRFASAISMPSCPACGSMPRTLQSVSTGPRSWDRNASTYLRLPPRTVSHWGLSVTCSRPWFLKNRTK